MFLLFLFFMVASTVNLDFEPGKTEIVIWFLNISSYNQLQHNDLQDVIDWS